MKPTSVDTYKKYIVNQYLDNWKGYKTLGSISGGALGSGIGSAIGLADAIKAHRKGEFDDKGNVDTAKEYLKRMAPNAAKGLGIGAIAGTGLALAQKRLQTIKATRKPIKELLESVQKEALKNYIRDLKEEKTIVPHNIAQNVKDMLLKTLRLSKQANLAGVNIPKITGLKRMGALRAPQFFMREIGLGALGTAGLGAAYGFLNPEEITDPHTGKKETEGRFSSALSGGLKGGLYGGLLGMGLASGLGAIHHSSLARNMAADPAFAEHVAKHHPGATSVSAQDLINSNWFHRG